MRSKFMELSNFFESDNLIYAMASFIPDISIDCEPPYIKGVPDSCWIKYNPKIWRPNIAVKNDCEALVGMSIQRLNN